MASPVFLLFQRARDYVSVEIGFGLERHKRTQGVRILSSRKPQRETLTLRTLKKMVVLDVCWARYVLCVLGTVRAALTALGDFC